LWDYIHYAANFVVTNFFAIFENTSWSEKKGKQEDIGISFHFDIFLNLTLENII
jgi:hypothetical protein